MKRIVRSAADPTLDVEHPASPYKGAEVKQEFKSRVDINSIRKGMDRGIIPAWVKPQTPYYGDFTKGPKSLTEAVNLIEDAHAAFETLPLEMRRELDHDFRNLESAPIELFEKYGLAKRPETPPAGSSSSEAPPAAKPDKVPAEGKGGAKKPPAESAEG